MMIKKGNEMTKEQLMEEYLNGPTTKFAVYQVPEETPMNLIRDISFLTPKEVEAVSEYHELVGFVEAVDLEQVFFYGNMEHEKFTMVGPMRSVSVGDIIHNLKTDETFVVARFGFEKINMKEAA
jgi:hypothetical protein